jgi:hypothetical protein
LIGQLFQRKVDQEAQNQEIEEYLKNRKRPS